MAKALLQHFTESEIRHELRGFPARAVAAVLALKQEPSDEQLLKAVPVTLAFYFPCGVSTDLTTQPPSARLREDLGVDSLTFAEAAFKMEELFRVRIENAELAEIKTLGEMRVFVKAKLLGEIAGNE